MKGGIEVLTRYLAKELGPRRNHREHAGSRGHRDRLQWRGRTRQQRTEKMVASGIALGRVGLPDDIGGAVAMLLSPESGWINGQRIEVSGGQLL